jgi:hypothetical protein
LSWLGDLREIGPSLVIPLPRGRALRVGIRVRGWFRFGPRRYTLVATEKFVEQLSGLGQRDAPSPEQVEGTKQRLRDMGAHIEGELKTVDE